MLNYFKITNKWYFIGLVSLIMVFCLYYHQNAHEISFMSSSPMLDVLYNHPGHKHDWSKYKQNHNKSNYNETEDKQRFHHWYNSYKEVNNSNATWKKGLNHFSDWSPEEKQKYLNGKKTRTRQNVNPLTQNDGNSTIPDVNSTNRNLGIKKNSGSSLLNINSALDSLNLGDLFSSLIPTTQNVISTSQTTNLLSFLENIISTPQNVISTPQNVISTPQNANLTTKNVNLTNQNFNSTTQNVSVISTPQNANLTTQNVNLTNQNFNSTTQNVSLQEQNTSSTHQNFNLTQQNVDSKTQNVNSTNQNLNLTTQNASSTQQNINSTQQNVNLTTQNVSSTQENINLTTQNDISTQKNNSSNYLTDLDKYMGQQNNNKKDKKNIPLFGSELAVEPPFYTNYSVNGKVDFRNTHYVTSVKDQGLTCGSCWAFGVTAALEGAMNIYFDNDFSNLYPFVASLSEQFFIDCAFNNQTILGCDGGDPYDALLWLNNQHDYVPIVNDFNYPYTGSMQTCNNDLLKMTQALDSVFIPHNKLNFSILAEGNTTNLEIAASYSPLTVMVDASTWLDYAGGILSCPNNTTPILNHVVLLVGFSDEFWVIKNSWGTNWGEAGYIRLAKGDTCGIAQYAIQMYWDLKASEGIDSIFPL